MSQFFRIRQLKYWSFSFSISPSNAYSGLISFRMDWFDLLADQETLKSLIQHHNSKASILWHSAFFMDISHDYWKNHTFDYMDLCQQILYFNMLSGFVIAFLPRNKHLLISWLQSQSTVILEPKKINSVTASTFPPSICHEVIGPDTMILIYFNVEFQTSLFILLFDSHQGALYFLFIFCH